MIAIRARGLVMLGWLLVTGAPTVAAQPTPTRDIERCDDLANCPPPVPAPEAAPTTPEPCTTNPASCPERAPRPPPATPPEPCTDPAKCPGVSEPCTDPAKCPVEPERERTLTSGGGLRVDLEASSVIRVAGAKLVDIKNLTMVRGHFSLSWGRPHVRYYAALDLALGASVADFGLGFDLQFLPIGIGFQLRDPQHTAFIGIAGGIGVSGAAPALPSAGVLPVQMVSVFRLSEKLNLILRGRAARSINSTSRDKGAPSLKSVDELDAMAAIQLGEFHYLEGRYFGVAYRELQGARFVGIVFGSGGAEEIMQE